MLVRSDRSTSYEDCVVRGACYLEEERGIGYSHSFFFLPQTRRSYLLCGVVTSEFFFSRMDNYPAGSMNFFCIFGALNAGYICDMVGRRRTFSISCVIFITGILIQVRVRSISYL